MINEDALRANSRDSARALQQWMQDRKHELKRITPHQILCPVCGYIFKIELDTWIISCKNNGSKNASKSELFGIELSTASCMDLQIREIIE